MSEESPSIFPPQEMLLICNACGGERRIPEEELAKIVDVDAFKHFTQSTIVLYSCKCPRGKKCDIRMRMSVAFEEWKKLHPDVEID